ncbi:hypothetical protein [Streptomyces profundus]|uniref:hypothetical protein n=1 Tax=Streptomyces profundus TaxID=2867410 RepID=UPI001D15E4DC|nr:hypothetical protein [Streptomyces sp. MA3_2.13]UED85293.1 hypothetical protein K4G22_14725 [Streptomyces sp. MA3_2.13]
MDLSKANRSEHRTGTGDWRPGQNQRRRLGAAAGRAVDGLGSWYRARKVRAAQHEAAREKKGREKAREEAGLDPKTGQPPSADAVAEARRKALRASKLRYRARATAAGVAAGVVGLASWLRHPLHPIRAWRRARAVWDRLMGKARDAKAARDAALDGQGVPGERVNDPARVEPGGRAVPGVIGKLARVVLGKINDQDDEVLDDTRTREEKKTMDETTTFVRLSDAAEVMLQAARTFDPEKMVEFQALIEDLPIAMGLVQETVRVLAEKSAENLPVERVVVEEIGVGYRAMSKVITALEEVPAVYRKAHAADLERIDNPRNGVEAERKWNV